jgi:D-arabinono-1,4-lactone oxidase
LELQLVAELAKTDPTVPFRPSSSHTHHTWARTFYSRPELYLQPESVEEIQKIVKLARKCRRRIVVVGSGHSPSDITCSSSWMINLDNFAQQLRVDPENKTLTVQAGMRLRELNAKAAEYGLTMSNLGSIDEQSVAGAMATNTHGSSMFHGPLVENVRSLRLVLGNGAVVRCSPSQDPDLFRAALVSLGALGVVVEVEYQLVPDSRIEWVQTVMPLQDVLRTWDDGLWTEAEFTRIWWLPYTRRAVVWRANRTDKPLRKPKGSWYGGIVGYHTYRLLLWLSNRFPHILPTVEWFVFGMQYGFSNGSRTDAVQQQREGLLMNCLYSQFVNEWALPFEKGRTAIEDLDAIFHGRPRFGVHLDAGACYIHAPIEVRVSIPYHQANSARPYLDNTCASSPTLFLNATLYRPFGEDPPCREEYYRAFEYLMKEKGGKPHWAKNFSSETTKQDIENMYGDDLNKWRSMRREADPDGVFTSDWLRRNVLEDSPEDRSAQTKQRQSHPFSALGLARARDHLPLLPLLPCEERAVATLPWKDGGGGVEWFGSRAVDSADALGATMGGMLGMKARSSGSSEESFDVLAPAEAEASVRLEDDEWEERYGR